jgi:hypothetical protein
MQRLAESQRAKHLLDGAMAASQYFEEALRLVAADLTGRFNDSILILCRS